MLCRLMAPQNHALSRLIGPPISVPVLDHVLQGIAGPAALRRHLSGVFDDCSALFASNSRADPRRRLLPLLVTKLMATPLASCDASPPAVVI